MRWQAEGKGAPLARPGAYRDAGSHAVRQRFDQRQPRGALAAGAIVVDAVKPLKDARLLGKRDARSAIADLENPPISLLARLQGDGAVGVLDGVVYQVERDLLEVVGIGTDGNGMIPILVACALDFDLQNSLNMGVMFFGKRAPTAQIGMMWFPGGPALSGNWQKRQKGKSRD